MQDSTKDMTYGSPLKLIIGFAVPMLLGLLFQQFYSMVDTIIVGKWLGIDSLAAVGSTGSINFMIIGFCTGVCSGFAIPVAQCFGSKDYDSLRKFVTNSIWLSAIFSAVMTAVVCFFCMDILKAMKTPDNIIDEAYIYLFIIFAGIPATYLYNLLSGIMRSLGDSKTPVYFLIFSALLNIILDIISIKVLNMGVEGPAYATVISQAVSGILCIVFMVKNFDILHTKKGDWKFSPHHAARLFAMGVPMGLQYSITAIGSVVLQTAVNTLGSMAVAAVTAGTKVIMFFCCPFDALGGTMATYAGQNVGAGKFDRIKQGLKVAALSGFIYSAAAALILILFGKSISLLFMDSDQTEILSQVHFFLIVNSLGYPLLTLVNTVRFSIQGMGFSMFAVIAGICEMVARAAVGFGLVPVFGYNAVCFASVLAWVAADIFLIPAFCYCLKKLKNNSPDAVPCAME